MQLRVMLTRTTALGTQLQMNPSVVLNKAATLGKVVNGFVSMLLANLILRVAVQFSKILGQQLVGVVRVARATVMIQVARATVMIQAARATVARAVVPRAVVPLAQAVPQATLQAALQFHVRTPLTKLIVAPPLVALGTAGFAQTKIRAVVARTVV